MTRYTVTWHPEAEDELAELWISAEDQDQITAAVQAIDTALRSDASAKREAVAENLRAFHAPPLRVLFVARESDCVVQIEMIRRI
jgi:mRNA-degrading endonuclease RelE of RelBE toxin-antitoxin system